MNQHPPSILFLATFAYSSVVVLPVAAIAFGGWLGVSVWVLASSACGFVGSRVLSRHSFAQTPPPQVRELNRPEGVMADWNDS